jgi:hypothetical protein
MMTVPVDAMLNVKFIALPKFASLTFGFVSSPLATVATPAAATDVAVMYTELLAAMIGPRMILL